MPTKLQLSSFLFAFWLAATAYAFWWFQARDMRPYDLDMSSLIEEQSLTHSLATLLAPIKTDGKKTYLVHFWQPECSCNRFNRSHVQQIAEKYKEKGFQLITIAQPHANYSQQALMQLAKKEFNSIVIIDEQRLLSGKARIPGAPSAAVINKNGQLAYLGPYSDSSFCGLGGTAFVERVADLLIQGENPSILNTMVFGCFCDWDSNKIQTT